METTQLVLSQLKNFLS